MKIRKNEQKKEFFFFQKNVDDDNDNNNDKYVGLKQKIYYIYLIFIL